VKELFFIPFLPSKEGKRMKKGEKSKEKSKLVAV